MDQKAECKQAGGVCSYSIYCGWMYMYVSVHKPLIVDPPR